MRQLGWHSTRQKRVKVEFLSEEAPVDGNPDNSFGGTFLPSRERERGNEKAREIETKGEREKERERKLVLMIPLD